MTNLDTRAAKKLLANLDALDLGDKFPTEVRTHLARAETLTEAAHGQDDDRFRLTRAEVVAKLANGDLDPTEAQELLIDAHARADVGNLTKDALLDAAARAGRTAGSLLIERGETIVSDVFAPEGQRLVDQATTALDNIPPEVTNADEAILAGTKAVKAWGQLADANSRWARLLDLIRSLRSDRILDGNPNDQFLNYRQPDRVLGGNLGEAIGNGAEPRIATDAGASAEYAEFQRTEAERLAAETPQKPAPYYAPQFDPAFRKAVDDEATRIEKATADA